MIVVIRRFLLAACLSVLFLSSYAHGVNVMCAADTNGDGYVDSVESCNAGNDVYGNSSYLCPVQTADCSLEQWRCPIDNSVYTQEGNCTADCSDTSGCSIQTVIVRESGEYRVETDSYGLGLGIDTVDVQCGLYYNGIEYSLNTATGGSGTMTLYDSCPTLCTDHYIYFRILQISPTYYALEYLDQDPGGTDHFNCETPPVTDDAHGTGWHTLWDIDLGYQVPTGTDTDTVAGTTVSFCLDVISTGDFAASGMPDVTTTCTTEINSATLHDVVHSGSGSGNYKLAFRYSISVDLRKFICPLDSGYAQRCTDVGASADSFCPRNIASDGATDANGFNFNSSSLQCESAPLCNTDAGARHYFDPAYDATDGRCEAAAYTESVCSQTDAFGNCTAWGTQYTCSTEYNWNYDSNGGTGTYLTYSYGTVDQSQGVCYKTPDCYAGSTFDAASDKCVLAAYLECKSNPPSDCTGSGLSRTCTVSETCDWEPVCPTGYDCDYTNPVTPTCPSGGTLDGSLDKCVMEMVDVCPAGYTFNTGTDACEVDPGCPAGGAYNTSTDVCEATASFSCDAGYTYNSATNRCEADPPCNNGTYDPNNDICIANATITCPSAGYTYSSTDRVCLAAATCSDGGTLDGAIDKCVLSYSCPAGYTLNTATDTCENTTISCPSGGSYNSTDNICTASYSASCPGGYSWNTGRDRCETSASCPSGGSYDGASNQCTASTTGYACGAGYTYNSSRGRCEKSPACLLGSYNSSTNQCENQQPLIDFCAGYGTTYHTQIDDCWLGISCGSGGWNATNDRCERSPNPFPQPPCPPGYFFNGGLCIASGSCSAGSIDYTWDVCNTGYVSSTGASSICGTAAGSVNSWIDTANDTCGYDVYCPGGALDTANDVCYMGATSTCPSGYTLSGSTCYASATCSSGTLDGTNDICYYTLSSVCPSGYTYNSTSDRCEVSASCSGGGTFDGANDICTASPGCAGSYLFNGTNDQCETSPSCSGGGAYGSGLDQCSETENSSCPGSMVYNNATGQCEENVSCPTGGNLDASTDLCEQDSVTSCTADYSYDPTNLICIADAQCTDGILSEINNKCSASGSSVCPSEYYFSSSNDKCLKNPVCDNSSYDSSTDQCYECSSSFECLDINSDGNYQCSEFSCIDLDSNPPATSTADMTYYQNDSTVDSSGCTGTVYIFNGEPNECRTAGKQTIGAANGCCESDPSGALGVDPICSVDEAQTVAAKNSGKCHYVGEYCKEDWLGSCVQQAQMYCCFSSMLARIIQEQGRVQLTSFGTDGGWKESNFADPIQHPNCRGFTDEEFQMLDFSKIDLSEYFDEITSSISQQVEDDMINQLYDFYNTLQ